MILRLTASSNLNINLILVEVQLPPVYETIPKICQIGTAGGLVCSQNELAWLSSGSDGCDVSLQLASAFVCVQNVHAITQVICLQAAARLLQTRLFWQIVGAIKMEKACLFQKQPRLLCVATSQTSGEGFRLDGFRGRPGRRC